jgi:hypothetical protein
MNYCYIHKHDWLRDRERERERVGGGERVEKSGKIKGFMFGENEDFISLFRVWNYFQTNMEQDYLYDTVVVPIKHRHRPQATSGKS